MSLCLGWISSSCKAPPLSPPGPGCMGSKPSWRDVNIIIIFFDFPASRKPFWGGEPLVPKFYLTVFQQLSLHKNKYRSTYFIIILGNNFTIRDILIINTRPKPAYGQQGLDWIVGPGYSFVVFSTNRHGVPTDFH